MLNQNIVLQVASILAIIIALYHGFVGEGMMRKMAITPAGQKPLMRGAFHIGTLGWLAGGVLLFVASLLDSGLARNGIVFAYVFVYGIPAIGNAVINRGRPNIGWISLAAIVVLALFGR